MSGEKTKISIIVPVLDEGVGLCSFLDALPSADEEIEIILADGGSTDGSITQIEADVSHIVRSAKGRATQMNAGAAIASGEYLLFLHSDTYLPVEFKSLVLAEEPAWGRFDVRLSGEHWAFRMIEFMMNWKSRTTGICTGDQAIFLKRTLFESMGGYASIPLMEDIELTSRLSKMSEPACISTKLITSSRRWEEKGILKTMFLMWYLRIRFATGTSADILVKKYYK
ncbi:MAG: rSAM/selenodomain-associated transferase 2 [Candidatus Azotimanducaceae bacterium]|jgi:rSAM/selenodomain-associated transferase 2